MDRDHWMRVSPASATARRMPHTAMVTTALAAVLVGALSACGVPAASTPETTSSSAAATGTAHPPSAATTLQLCRAAFTSGEILSWASGTVAQFHEYQYGGPTPTHPLADAFMDLPGETRGAWCGLRADADTIRWWAVVDGREPVKAIDITGPGEGTPRGEVQRPPVVP